MKINRIITILQKLNIDFTIHFSKNSPKLIFKKYIRKFPIITIYLRRNQIIAQIKKLIPKKELTKELVFGLPKKELKRLFLGLIYGDGNIATKKDKTIFQNFDADKHWIGKNYRIRFINTNLNTINYFQILANRL